MKEIRAGIDREHRRRLAEVAVVGALRKAKGWTFVYLAEHSGLDDAFLHNLEHGTKEPCLNTIDILARSLKLSISELMRGV